MQSLGLATIPPRSDGRFKSLFWPTIRHDGDLEYISEQGFWICLFVAVSSYAVGTIRGHPIASLFDFAFFFLTGIGVRQRSNAAGIIAFTSYLCSALIAQRTTGHGFGILNLVFLALLLANVRGVWLSSKWGTDNELPPVDRLNDTFFDKLSGRLPEIAWPKTKWLFALLALIELASMMLMLTAPRSPVPR